MFSSPFEAKHACIDSLCSAPTEVMWELVNSPVATRFEPWAEADYRVNGKDWKGTDITLSHTVGMWWTCKVIIALGTQPHIHVRAHTHTLTISERHKHLDVRYVSFKIKVLTRTKFWTYVLNITDERVQFGVAPVSQIQKAGLYSLTADTDTWSWMYRPDENRWTETDEQHMYRLFFWFHIDTL